MAGPLDPAAALAALRRVDFDWTRSLASVWRDTAPDVAELNGDLGRGLVEDFAARTSESAEANPLGRVLLGRTGAGKTHLLATLRRAAWQRGGWFVLLDLLELVTFWDMAAACYVTALGQPMPLSGRSQGEELVERLRRQLGLGGGLLRRLGLGRGAAGATLGTALVEALRRRDAAGAGAHREVVMALASLVSAPPPLQDAARAWLLGSTLEAADLRALGLRGAAGPRPVVEGLSWLMAKAGPTLCAIDQIDAIVSVIHAAHSPDPAASAAMQRRAAAVIDDIAGGLMALRDVTRRTMIVLSTLPRTWEILQERALTSFAARFQAPTRLAQITRPDLAQRLVEARLTRPYAESRFAAPYPTWPFRPEAFATVPPWSPRELLQACEAHRSLCLDTGTIAELARFEATAAEPPPAATTGANGVDLDARYEALQLAATPPAFGDAPGQEASLRSALAAWVRRAALAPGEEPILDANGLDMGARLRIVADAESGAERVACFCAVPATNPIAVQRRLRTAQQAAGIDPALPFRRLFVLRHDAWPSGARTTELVRAFEAAGGVTVWPSEADWRRLRALGTLETERAPGLEPWLRALPPDRLPALFATLDRFAATPVAMVPAPPRLSPEAAPPASAPTPETAEPVAAAASSAPVAPQPRPAAPLAPAPVVQHSIPLGLRTGDRQPVSLSLASLPRHVAVVAGSGSGKTVLLRRLVEEAALAGIPSILIDSNNDLVRLADPWPDPSAPVLGVADQARAATFLRIAEVVVWTPGRSRGNPLALAPLPDFAAVGADPDERDQAVGMAAAALEPLLPAGASGRLRAGVLSDALRAFAAAGGGRLDDLVALLRDLPADASRIDRAPRLAGEVANALLAEQARNPLLQAGAATLDPAALLLGSPGRVRVSVVSLAGLASDAARQDFVGRLLMALFGHVRRHPAPPDRPVQGLLVMDEAQNFAPSGSTPPSRPATAALARQARKYGLGMVFATQTPRGVDHTVIANCTTQLFGRCNSPAAIEAVRDMLASRGGAADDLGRLETGVFYLTGEGLARPQKIATPLCLTHHPASPPGEDEVIARAARSRPSASTP